MKRSNLYISFLVFLCFSDHTALAQRALDIMPFGIMQPLPVKFSAYIDDPDKISFMIKNNLFVEQDFYLEFKLLKEGNLFAHSIVSDRLSADFAGLTVPAAGVLNVTGSELQMLYASLSDFIILQSGENPANFLLDGALPEGSYELCFLAVDLETGVPLSEFTCSMPFFIQNYPAPEFFPQPDAYETTVINPDALEFLFQWRHDFISMGSDGLHYELKFIELDGEVDSEITFVDDILLNNPGDIFFEVNTMEDKLYLYDFLIDPPLTLNKFYAARVRIVDEQGQFRFENDGNSRPAILYYGNPDDLEAADAYHLTVHYPQAGDTLPFASTPLVLEFEQERLDFNRFNYQFSINGQGNLSLGYSEAMPYTEANPQIDEEDLSRLYLSGQNEVEQILSNGYERGQHYALRAHNIEIGFPENDERHNLPPKSSEFVFGMPRPVLQMPSQNETVEIETPVHFSFLTGNDPRTLIPTDGFVVDQISNPAQGVTEGYSLHEKWVLQLCEDSTFAADKIIFTEQNLLQTFSEGMDYLELSEAIYKTEEITYSDPLFQGDYFWRVVYLKNPFEEFSDQQLKNLTPDQFYHSSPVFKFNIADSEPILVEEESPDSTSDCNDICFLTETNYPLELTPVSSRSGMSDQNVIKAGRFNVTITSINFSGETASGEGTVNVNFYGFGATVKVEYSDIKINSSSQLIDGMIKAKKDQLEISDVLESIGYEGINPEEMLTDEQADMVNNVLETYRQISALATGEPIGMPLGINYEYGDVELLFALTNMSFEPREAHCQILINVPLQMFDEIRYLSMGASRICLTPSGFGPEATLHMVKAFHFDIGDFEEPLVHNAADLDNFTVSLLGPEDLDNQENIQATKLSFDCNGIKDFGIRGKIHFPTTMLRKEDANGNLITNERAVGTFYFALGRDRIFEEENSTESDSEESEQNNASSDDQRSIHIVAEIESMDQFQIVGLRDWSIGVERAYFDFSQLENAIGFEDVVPEDYSHTTFSDGEEEEHWQGFWLQQSKMRLPNFLNEGGERLEINVSNMIIDDEYFTANINVLPDLQGELEEGWTISLDSIWLQITESTFRDGGIKGEMGTPFIAENMEYTSVLSYEDADTTGEEGELEYAFTVRPAETVAMPALMANVNLTRETHIKLGYKANIMDPEDEDGKQLVIEAAFAGGIGISTDFINDTEILSSLPFDLSLMQLPFLLKYSTIDGIDGYFGFSPEASQALSSGINEIQAAFTEAADDLESITSYLTDMENAEGGQGSMAGFSFGIREMGIGGNGLDSLNLILHPFINLVVDEENGFGGSAKLTLVGGYDAASKKFVLKSPYVLGASVDIDAMFSGIGVKGGICFYNLPDDKGVKGFIDVALPIVRIQAKAQFGLKNMGQSNEYPYFFFQFLTRIASGIDVGNYTPIGSIGVSFYGLGGGIFYNMGYRSPALSGPNGGASPEGPPPADGEPIPDPGQDDLCSFDFPGFFDSLGAFRIEATIVIGTTTNSTPVNMDITLGANIAIGSSAFGGSMDIEVKGYV
ncbi:MAG: hypothetical protein HKN76_10215, partial [Saprospiraceae bacterium]|nr:hypothetical protein [Saprospiraceae bacterium]